MQATDYFLLLFSILGTGLSDFYLDLTNQPPSAGAASWKDLFRSSTYGRNVHAQIMAMDKSSSVAPAVTEQPSLITRMFAQTLYFLKYYTRDQGFYFRRLWCLIVIALFIGTVYLRLVPEVEYLTRYAGAIFFSIWAVLFSAVASTGLLARDRTQAMEQVTNSKNENENE